MSVFVKRWHYCPIIIGVVDCVVLARGPELNDRGHCTVTTPVPSVATDHVCTHADLGPGTAWPVQQPQLILTCPSYSHPQIQHSDLETILMLELLSNYCLSLAAK